MTTRFCRFDLRTTDAGGAHAFYASVLGHDRSAIWPLHEQALVRGARPHWLGRLGVPDVDQAVTAFIERGATPLGPERPTADGGRAAVLRDPGGAVVAVGTPPLAKRAASAQVVWHVLNTRDAGRASTNYGDLFGWAMTERVDLGAQGVFRQFAWHAGGPNVGAMGDIGSRPGVHAHWLFFFRVSAVDPAIARTHAAGGVVIAPVTLPDGRRACVCDDPQGAAFAFCER